MFPVLAGHARPLRPRLLRDWFSAIQPDLYLDTRPEPVEGRDEAIAGEPPQVRIADAREIGRRRSGAAVRGAHSQAFPIERLQLFGIGVLMPQIAEYIAASWSDLLGCHVGVRADVPRGMPVRIPAWQAKRLLHGGPRSRDSLAASDGRR